MRKLQIESILLEFEKEMEAYITPSIRAEILNSLINTYQFNFKTLNDTKASMDEMKLLEEVELSKKILDEFHYIGNLDKIPITKTKPVKRDMELFKQLLGLITEIVCRKYQVDSIILE